MSNNSDKIPPRLLNRLFVERLDIAESGSIRENLRRVEELTQAFLGEQLVKRAPRVRVSNVSVGKIANRISVSYTLSDADQDRRFTWEETEQDLLAYDVPVTTLLDNHLSKSLGEL